MAVLFLDNRRLRDTGLALLALLGLSPFFANALAQANPGQSMAYYTRQPAFFIPFQLDPNEQRIQEILLHVSHDYGATYSPVATAGPTARSFRFQAQRGDGWYWFTTQTKEQEGRLSPAKVNLAPPGLKVCVDTSPPQVALRAVQPHQGTMAVEWDVRDENVDPSSLRLEYQRAGIRDPRGWYNLPAPQQAQGQYSWTPTIQGPVDVRLQIHDRAGNPGEAIATVTPGVFPTGAMPRAAAPDNIIFVKSRNFQLNYDIENVGPSQVGTVDVWMLFNNRWEPYPEKAKAQGPFPVTVRSEGRYGFTLIPHSGVDLSEKPPQAGEQPQLWVEVDETKPQVALRPPVVGRGPDSGKLTIFWTATDKYLAAQPIRILYAENPQAPPEQWTVLARDLPNTPNSYTRTTEGLPYQFYVRVEAVDRAGNVGAAVTRETVKVDLKIPRISRLEVGALEAGTPSPTSPGGQSGLSASPLTSPSAPFSQPSPHSGDGNTGTSVPPP